MVNENIRASEVLVIDEEGNSLGITKIEDALQMARRKNLDLVCVAPTAKNPVCRFMDYSKFRYEQQRKARDAKKNQKIVVVKEIWLTPVINNNDLETKLKQGRKFLMDGDKLRVTMKFRSFRMVNQDSMHLEVLEKFITGTNDIATVEAAPKLEGKNMSLILVPSKDKKQQQGV